jgi:DNA-binding MarR family transcriptional regulator
VTNDNELIDAFMTASRVLLAVAAQSVGAADAEVSLPQYRVLVILASRGPQRIGDLAQQLSVNSSSVTRMCDRLETHGLVRREPSSDDRRVVCVSITPLGQRLVRQVSKGRRQEIGRILRAMPTESHDPLLSALRAFTDAAQEIPEQQWPRSWDVS